jgi:hypothetical protein
MHGGQLAVAVPGDDSGVVVGPLRPGSAAAAGERPAPDLAAVLTSADLLLTLVQLDPSVGGEYIATWATDAVVTVTTGRSSGAKVNAVGEMIRIAGLRLAPAVLLSVDKADESLGVVPRAAPSASVAYSVAGGL